MPISKYSTTRISVSIKHEERHESGDVQTVGQRVDQLLTEAEKRNDKVTCVTLRNVHDCK